MSLAENHPQSAGRVLLALLPLMLVVLSAYTVIGLALPVVPIHVHQTLGFGTFVVGVVAGSQSATAVLSRIWSGRYSDSSGAKRAVVLGLLGGAVAGTLHLLSIGFEGTPTVSVSILLLARGLLGAAQSFVITGAVGWGLMLVSPRDAGKVIAWVGSAAWGAIGVGAPIGNGIFAAYGFVAIAAATTLLPLATLLLVVRLPPIAPRHRTQPPVKTVIRAVWLPGVGLSFCSFGFGAMTTFSALLFVDRGWDPAWLPLTVFAVAFIGARIFFGHLSDRLGGARVALSCVLVEAAGQALMWIAPWPALALAGAGLTGFGYSLVYPGLGLEAVRRAPEQSGALAMGTYTAFLDVALGVGTPVLGLVAAQAGLGAVFLCSALVVACTMPVAARLLNRGA